MKSIRLNFLVLISITLAGCQLVDHGVRPVSNLYCDNFLVYDICAQDLNRDGVVELVYFEDSREVFMYRDGADAEIPTGLEMHRCARVMGDDLVATTSRLFFVDETTTYLARTDIRGQMLLKYIAFLPGVTACNMRAMEAVGGGEASS